MKNDYLNIITHLKENEIVSSKNFRSFLQDSSYSIESDVEFIKILIAW